MAYFYYNTETGLVAQKENTEKDNDVCIWTSCS